MDGVSLVNALLAAGETRDQHEFLSCFTPDATVRHSFCGSEESVQAAAALAKS
jgi:hypothetical protein